MTQKNYPAPNDEVRQLGALFLNSFSLARHPLDGHKLEFRHQNRCFAAGDSQCHGDTLGAF